MKDTTDMNAIAPGTMDLKVERGLGRAFVGLIEERERQDRQWGGPKHDDEHGPEDWLDFIEAQLIRAGLDAGANDDEGYRRNFVKIGALALAALESMNRKAEVSRVSGR